MYLYRKPKTQRKCSKPSTLKQKKQRALAFMLFRVTGMSIPYVSDNIPLSEKLRIQIREARQEIARLQRVIREELKEL